MRLLIITQKVDKDDPILGFFHRWLEEFAKNYEFVTVICLEMGQYHLPKNVKVLSLGKEESKSRPKYIFRFYKYIWQERKNYDSVFVHMNQEYVLLGWKFWKLWGKKIFLWRNHAKGNLLTRMAVLFSNKVFCTSPSSYTAKFRKTKIMPVGIDTDFFKPDLAVPKMPNSILFLGRIAPVKRVLEFVDWVKDKNFETITIVGDALLKNREYERQVHERVSKYHLDSKVKFMRAVNQEEVKMLYQSHETYANFTLAGSMDKTIVEASACGMKLEIRNPDLKNFRFEDHSLKALMSRLKEEIF